MGAMSNDSSQLSHLVGMYKCIQSAGAAGVFRMDANAAPYLTELVVSWALCGAGALFVIPVLWLRATDKTPECIVQCTVDVEVCIETRRPSDVISEKDIGSLDLERERRESESRVYTLQW